MPLAILVIALFLASMHGARSEEPHAHGQTVPDWYENACCNNRDCKPVDGKPEPEAVMHGGKPAYRYRGMVFTQDKFKRSQDERFHVCVQPHMGIPLCIYLPTMT